MKFQFHRLDWEFASVFRIAYRTRTHVETVVVELEEGGRIGRGEAAGVSYHGESAESLLRQLEGIAGYLNDGLTRADLQNLLPAGGARSAIDCALWDLEAKRAGVRAWQLAGFESVHPLTTDFTLSVDTPEAMSRAAVAASRYPLLKLKLTGAGDLERVAAIRAARPDADLIVDANQAWGERELHELTPRLAEFGIKLIEQPLPLGKDEPLRGFASPIPLCADESCQTVSSLPEMVGKYQYVNIKLDKAGGLTEALQLAHAARALGLKLMVGCMAGSSLGMAPAFIVGQLADIIDLDGPLLLKSDFPHAIRYEGSQMLPPEAALWG